MSLNRRDVLKIAAVAGAAVTLPLARSGFTGTTAVRMAASKMPAPFTLPFVRPSELGPVGTRP